MIQEARGAVDGDHPTSRTHQVGQVQGGEARSASEIEDRRGAPEARPAPQGQGPFGPDPVLEGESLHLLVPGAQEVVVAAGA